MTCINWSGMGRKKKDLDRIGRINHWQRGPIGICLKLFNLKFLARGIDGHHNHLWICYHTDIHHDSRWQPSWRTRNRFFLTYYFEGWGAFARSFIFKGTVILSCPGPCMVFCLRFREWKEEVVGKTWRGWLFLMICLGRKLLQSLSTEFGSRGFLWREQVSG